MSSTRTSLDVFRKAFRGDLIVPTDPQYPEAISRWAVNTQRNAKIVAFVKDAQDVSLAIKYAKEEKLPVAIKGGGHSMSSASSIEDGLVIDLSRYVNTVRVDVERKVAFVGGGAVWKTVDEAAIEHGLATVAGTVNHTGVGGLLLGGGYGYLSGSYGLVIDNLLEATIVLAHGSIITTSSSKHPDLFWAIRGGGSNFGVCTEFVLKLYPQRRTVFGGMVKFPQQKLESVGKALEEWHERGQDEKEAIYVVIGRDPVNRNPFIGLILVFNGSEQEGRTAFKSFFDLEPSASTCQQIPYPQVNTITLPMAVPGKHRYTSSVHENAPSHQIFIQEFEKLTSLSSKARPGFDIGIIHEYLAKDKICAIGSGETAFYCRGEKYNTLMLTTWEDDAEGENAKYAREVVAELAAFTIKAQNDTDNIGYGNYNANDGQVVNKSSSKSKTLFGDNYPRLQQIKKKYDPDMVFSRWFPIVPA